MESDTEKKSGSREAKAHESAIVFMDLELDDG